MTDDLERDLGEYDGIGGWTEPDHYDGPPEPPPDPIAAEAMARHRGRAMFQLYELERLRDAEVARIDRWFADRSAAPRRKLEWLERSLQAYAYRVNLENPRIHTVHLPDAVMEVRRPSSRGVVRVDDEDLFMEWAERAAPDLIRHGLSHPAKDRIAKLRVVDGRYVTDGGEMVPGVVNEVQTEPTITVKEA